MKHVVFDVGAVLVEWNPVMAWAEDLGRTEAEAFLKRINFDKLNLACDAGATFEEAAALLQDKTDAARLAQYIERFALTLTNKIHETWDLLYALKNNGVRVFAITNWSAETWIEGCKVHPELADVFETTVVSGQVGIIKPSVEIYRHLCTKAGIEAADCVFTDDGLHNCLGAKAAGMDAIHFTGPQALAAGLKTRGLI